MGADPSRAGGWIEKQLMAAKSLESAIMPAGQKYEVRRKDKEGHREDGKNSGTS